MGLRFAPVLAAVALVGCGGPPDLSSGTHDFDITGAYHTRMGSLDVAGQLTLQENGEYLWLLTKPEALVMFGGETGNWVETPEGVTLTPGVLDREADSTFDTLTDRQTENARPKTLRLEGDVFTWSDGNMDLEIKPR